jgi:hypothetical protein
LTCSFLTIIILLLNSVFVFNFYIWNIEIFVMGVLLYEYLCLYIYVGCLQCSDSKYRSFLSLYLWVFPIVSAKINVIPVMVQTVMFDPRHFKLLINFCRWQSNIMKRYYNMVFFLAVTRCILWFLKFNAHIWGGIRCNFRNYFFNF